MKIRQILSIGCFLWILASLRLAAQQPEIHRKCWRSAPSPPTVSILALCPMPSSFSVILSLPSVFIDNFSQLITNILPQSVCHCIHFFHLIHLFYNPPQGYIHCHDAQLLPRAKVLCRCCLPAVRCRCKNA